MPIEANYRTSRIVLPDPIQRLLARRNGEASFLGDEQIEAAARLSRLIDRARMRQRVTMSYDPARIGSGGGRPVQADLSDGAADARSKLNQLASLLPADCWGVLIDVCGFETGLQQIESERGWPRRGAKLVLRIGLDQLARQWGLTSLAQGRDRARLTSWLPERPAMFAGDEETR